MPFAAAADVSYSYFDVNYQFGGDIDAGGGSIDNAGFGVKLSYAFSDAFFASFDYSSFSTDPSGLDTTDWAIAVPDTIVAIWSKSCLPSSPPTSTPYF